MQTPTLSPSAPDRGFAYDWEVRKNSEQSEIINHAQALEHFPSNFRRPGLFAEALQGLYEQIITRELDNQQEALRHKGLYEQIITRELDNQQEALRHIRVDSPGARWLADAIGELAEVDDEVAEEALPELLANTKKHARRIIFALAKQPIAPTVYPTADGEIALYFKSPVAASSVLILIGNDGQAACLSYINGKNRRARYDDASDLPDEFVKEQIWALKEPAFP